MASRATGGTFAAFLISGAILGFAGGAILGTQADVSEGDNATPNSSATSPADPGGGAGADGGGDPPASEPADDAGAESDDPTDEPTEESDSNTALSLSTQQDSVGASDRIDIAGTINPAKEGVSVQLQRSVDGSEFEDFPVDPWETDADGEFGGYVQSSRSGENEFRVVLIDNPDVTSEPVAVTIG